VLAQVLPELAVTEASAEPGGGGGAWKVVVQIRNEGYLPSYGTEQAMTTRAVRSHVPVTAALSDGLALVSGPAYHAGDPAPRRPEPR
jgi:hypothetical protein